MAPAKVVGLMVVTEPEAFPDLLRRLRRAAGLTQDQLSERAGVSTRSVSNLERAHNQRPRRETAVMLADGLSLAGQERTSFLESARRRPPAVAAASDHAALPPLPAPGDALLGREREQRAIEDLIGRQGVRLLTLTGPGGVGKTRLATEIAREMTGAFADGVLFLRLDGLSDPALVLPTLTGALQLQESGGNLPLRERLAAYLADRRMLIVLDNLEHLLPAAIDLPDLLGHAPGVTVLATSREALRVRGERVFTVSPLPRPDLATWQGAAAALGPHDSPAVALYVERARGVRPDLAVDPATLDGRRGLAAIAEICYRLDGLPLAIELAAQTHALSLAAMLAMMNGAGLPMLAAGGRDQPARLQTMEAAIAWSYALLTDDEQSLFRALAVCAGGFPLSAAAAITGVTEPLRDDPLTWHGSALAGAIAALASKHLLSEETTAASAAEPRFRMLEPIRLFALDRLREAGEEPLTRLRHARYFAALAEALDRLSLGPEAEIWFPALAADLDNFRAAQDAIACWQQPMRQALGEATVEATIDERIEPDSAGDPGDRRGAARGRSMRGGTRAGSGVAAAEHAGQHRLSDGTEYGWR